MTIKLHSAQDATATSVITGIYNDLLAASSFASGGQQSVTMLTGLSADELQVVDRTDANVLSFELNEIISTNPTVSSLWQSMYKVIYDANVAIEGIKSSGNITSTVKNQLLGEAMVIRAFTYFYLVNLFGDVPLVVDTDYNSNKEQPRTRSLEVYNQIVDDLTTAKRPFGGQISNGRSCSD